MYEQTQLCHYSSSPVHNPALPLGQHIGPIDQPGLQLATNGDILIGRGDNGMIRNQSFDT